MTVKFTKCGVGAESGDESLLFEFLDHELPEFVEFEYTADLIKNKFVGSLQTSQHNGTFLEPINIDFEFFGQYVNKNGSLINAKQRLDELLRIQNRVIKFWFEGIKQLVIIEKVKFKIHNYQRIVGTISLVPHDLQIAINPQTVEKTKLQSYILSTTPVTPPPEATNNKGNPALDAELIKANKLEADKKGVYSVINGQQDKLIRLNKKLLVENNELFARNDRIKEILKNTDIYSSTKGGKLDYANQYRKAQVDYVNTLKKEISTTEKNIKVLSEKAGIK